ncbi:MAG: hypothetical protein MJA83_15970, partial [Gammaproteobacteria bacterium]|nr:hypothetical protein [Gammaproteobacteria bacterium]
MAVNYRRSQFFNCVLLCLFSPVAVAEIAIEDFFKNPLSKQVVISPDGKYLATTVPIDDKTNLVFVDTETIRPVHALKASDSRHIDRVLWVNNRRVIFNTLYQRGKLDFFERTRDLFAVDVDGKHDTILTRIRGRYKYTKILNLLPDDPNWILVQRDRFNPRTVQMQVHNKVVTSPRIYDIPHVNPPTQSGRFYSDQQGISRIYIGDVPDRTAFDIWYRDVGDKNWRRIKEYSIDWESYFLLGFNKAGTKAYFLINRNGNIRGLYSFDPATNKYALLFSHPVVDVNPWQIIYDFDRVPIGVWYDDGRYRMELFDQENEMSGIYRMLEKAFAGSAVSVTSHTRDKRKLVVHVWSDRNPGDFYLFDRDSGEVRYLFSAMPWIDPEEMHEKQAIRLKARDGLELHGYLSLPESRAGKPAPMIVIPHGGPHGRRDYWQYDPV